jgi:hypothetical protein
LLSPALRIDNLSNRYRVQSAAPRGAYEYRTLRDELARLSRAPWRRRQATGAEESFWGLKEIGFEVEPGEAVVERENGRLVSPATRPP